MKTQKQPTQYESDKAMRDALSKMSPDELARLCSCLDVGYDRKENSIWIQISRGCYFFPLVALWVTYDRTKSFDTALAAAFICCYPAMCVNALIERLKHWEKFAVGLHSKLKAQKPIATEGKAE